MGEVSRPERHSEEKIGSHAACREKRSRKDVWDVSHFHTKPELIVVKLQEEYRVPEDFYFSVNRKEQPIWLGQTISLLPAAPSPVVAGGSGGSHSMFPSQPSPAPFCSHLLHI